MTAVPLVRLYASLGGNASRNSYLWLLRPTSLRQHRLCLGQPERHVRGAVELEAVASSVWACSRWPILAYRVPTQLGATAPAAARQSVDLVHRSQKSPAPTAAARHPAPPRRAAGYAGIAAAPRPQSNCGPRPGTSEHRLGFSCRRESALLDTDRTARRAAATPHRRRGWSLPPSAPGGRHRRPAPDLPTPPGSARYAGSDGAGDVSGAGRG